MICTTKYFILSTSRIRKSQDLRFEENKMGFLGGTCAAILNKPQNAFHFIVVQLCRSLENNVFAL